MKRDRDDTDFRQIRASFKRTESDCPFCQVPKQLLIHENELAFAIRDAFPVTPLHTLVTVKRHIPEFFSLSRPEANAYTEILRLAKQDILREDLDVSGFNVGINEGEAAGQTVTHCHIHLIPRRKGDVENPAGGVRNIIPGKGPYQPCKRS